MQSYKNLFKKIIVVFFLFLVIGCFGIYNYYPNQALNYLTNRQFKEKNFTVHNETIDDINIQYVEGGNGSKNLIFVHGFRSSKSYWLPYIDTFYEDYHIYALDLPGHGLSGTCDHQHYDLKSMGESLHQFISKNQLKDVYLIGSSMGGGVCLAYASNHSDNIKALAVINALAVNPPHLSPVHQAIFEGKNLLLPTDMPSFIHMQQIVYNRELNLNFAMSHIVLKALTSNREFYLKAFNEMVSKGALEDVLPKITAPTLLIQSQKDLVVDPSSLDLIKRYMPTADSLLIENGAHTLTGNDRLKAQQSIYDYFKQRP